MDHTDIVIDRLRWIIECVAARLDEASNTSDPQRRETILAGSLVSVSAWAMQALECVIEEAIKNRELHTRSDA